MEEAIRYRCIAYNSNGTIIATRVCSEHELEDSHNTMMELDGVRIVHTVGPMTYWRTNERES